MNAPSVINSSLTASGYFLCKVDGTTSLTPASFISRYCAEETPSCSVNKCTWWILSASFSIWRQRSLQVVFTASIRKFSTGNSTLWYASAEGNRKSGFLLPSVTAWVDKCRSPCSIKSFSRWSSSDLPALDLRRLLTELANAINSSTESNPFLIISRTCNSSTSRKISYSTRRRSISCSSGSLEFLA